VVIAGPPFEDPGGFLDYRPGARGRGMDENRSAALLRPHRNRSPPGVGQGGLHSDRVGCSCGAEPARTVPGHASSVPWHASSVNRRLTRRASTTMIVLTLSKSERGEPREKPAGPSRPPYPNAREGTQQL